MTKYGLFGTFKATKGNGQRLSDILIEASQLLRNAPGCQIYVISRDAINIEKITVYEVWDSQEDHDNSLQNSEIKVLIGRALPLLDGEPEPGLVFEVLGGLGF